MFRAAQQVTADAVLRADACVVGCGPAGLTLAGELAGSGLTVVLLDSGGDGRDDTADSAAQQLSHGELSGDFYEPLHEVRHRGLGGSSAMWDYPTAGPGADGVRLRPLDPPDFAHRPWLPGSGWPFGRAELEPYYDRACDLLGIGRFAPDELPGPGGAAPEGFPLAVGSLVASEFRFSTTSALLAATLPDVRRSRDVHVHLGACVTELDCDGDTGRVRRVVVRTGPGHGFTVEARATVLAAGGIENPRLLLLSDGEHPGGIGNGHDLVGRFFMDHPHVYGGVLTLRDPALIPELAAYETHADDAGVSRIWKICLDEEVLEREQLLDSWTTLIPRETPRLRAAVEAGRRIGDDLRHGPAGLGALRDDVRAAVRGIPAAVPAVANKLRHGRVLTTHRPLPSWTRVGAAALVGGFELTHAVETAPDPDTRITLGRGVDRFGRRVPDLRFRWSERDIANVRRTHEIIAEEFSGSGVGDLVIEEGRELPERTVSASPHHHMGTTRMAEDPREGVVDADGRVHGVGNLFVTGSSVFPTGGKANPTLTIVALALRLADRLRAELS